MCKSDGAAACGNKTPEATLFTDDFRMWTRVKVLGRSCANLDLPPACTLRSRKFVCELRGSGWEAVVAQRSQRLSGGEVGMGGGV